MGFDREHLEKTLLENLRRSAQHLQQLLAQICSPKIHGTLIYKFYSGSYKAYHLQESTEQIVAALAGIAPEGTPLNPMFLQIVRAGTGHEFNVAHNERWFEHAAPIVTAFLHAKFFLEMAVKCAGSPDPQRSAASAWQALTELYRVYGPSVSVAGRVQ